VITLVATGVGVVLAVFVVMFGVFLVLTGGDAERAAERTTESITGVVTGVVVVGTAIATELVGVVFGAILSAPEAISTIVLGIVGYLSIDGILSLQPESWALLVIVAFVLATVGRDAAAEVSSR